jgi:hypothetical protein
VAVEWRRGRAAALALLFALALASCARTPVLPPPAPGATAPPESFPASAYDARARRLGTVYRIVPAESQLEIRVYRSGKLAHMGHNHIVSSNELNGFVLVGRRAADTRFDLWFPVATLTVDAPELRAAAGADFASRPSANDIKGTRANMLGEKLLDAARFPHVLVGGRQRGGNAQEPELELSITVHGAAHAVPATSLVEAADGSITASGELKLTHATLGLTPFSVFGGALAVDETITVRYRITARTP